MSKQVTVVRLDPVWGTVYLPRIVTALRNRGYRAYRQGLVDTFKSKHHRLLIGVETATCCVTYRPGGDCLRE